MTDKAEMRRNEKEYAVAVDGLLQTHNRSEAMSLAVGGDFLRMGSIEFSLLRAMGLTPESNVVDVGCGSGRLSLPLGRYLRGGRYVGTDVVPALLSHAQAVTQRPDFVFSRAENLTIPVEDGFADVVCFFSVLTHLPHVASFRYLQEAARALKGSGKIVFSFLEFRVTSHWAVFEATVSGAAPAGIRNEFIGRDAIHAWAQALNLRVDFVHDGDALTIPVQGADGQAVMTALGQSYCVLSKCDAGGWAGWDDIVFSAADRPDALALTVSVPLGLAQSGMRLFLAGQAPGGAWFNLLKGQFGEARMQDMTAVDLSGQTDVQVDVDLAIHQTSGLKVFAGFGLDIDDVVRNHRYKQIHETPLREREAQPDLGGMKRQKLERILPLLKPGVIQQVNEHCINCLPPAESDQFQLDVTENHSANVYDHKVMEIIAEHKAGLVLDCGAGSRLVSYPNVVNFEPVNYASTDVRGLADCLPFQDGVFDAVLSIAVLEHVKDPFAAAKELLRVLKPGGTLFCVVPFLQPYHAYPDHYYNMTHQGLVNLFGESIEVELLESYGTFLPMGSLNWILNAWARGLSWPTRQAFMNMRVADLMDDTAAYLDKPFVTELSHAKNLELGSAVALVGVKTRAC